MFIGLLGATGSTGECDVMLCCDAFLANDFRICLAMPLADSFEEKGVSAMGSRSCCACAAERVVLAKPLPGARPFGPRLIFLPETRSECGGSTL